MESKRIIISFVLAILLLAMSGTAAGQVRVGVAIAIAPPPIPVYEQPICPGDGYIWTPGYWAYDSDDADYYWVPGTWVPAPEVGFLWTPGYWAWGGDGFVFYDGYWGPIVGFYGGINYGFGYFGHGYEGGRWDGERFYYNTTVNRVNVEVVHNVYNTRVTETTTSHVSYNGGNGGITARPRPEEQAAAQQRHIAPVSTQVQHAQAARSDKQQHASVNRGAPAVAATTKPGALRESGVVRTREAGGPYNPPARPGNNAPKPAIHPNDLPRTGRPAPPNTGNPKQDLKYQQDQEKLQAKQQRDLQKLQQKQEQEHQQMAKQQADEAKRQQLEQRHQQQTQQLQQKHEQQAQQLHQRQQPPQPPQPHPQQNENKPPH